MKVSIIGAPRTKKTSNQGAIQRARGKGGQGCPACGTKLRVRVFPSKAWREWVKEAVIEVDGERLVQAASGMLLTKRGHPTKDAYYATSWTPVAEPVNCAAIFYREKNQGDLVGYLQGVADLLEERGVLANDKWIVGWDGSRLEVTAGRPRVEVELTPLTVPAV